MAVLRHEWWKLCRLSAKQVDRALRLLEKKGLVVCRLAGRGHVPAVHVAVQWENVNARVQACLAADDPEAYEPALAPLAPSTQVAGPQAAARPDGDAVSSPVLDELRRLCALVSPAEREHAVPQTAESCPLDGNEASP